jgi:hypothetical protein
MNTKNRNKIFKRLNNHFIKKIKKFLNNDYIIFPLNETGYSVVLKFLMEHVNNELKKEVDSKNIHPIEAIQIEDDLARMFSVENFNNMNINNMDIDFERIYKKYQLNKMKSNVK